MALIRGRNIAEVLIARTEATPEKTALMRKRDGLWQHVTFRDYENRVFEIARALKKLGLGRAQRVAVLSQTRPEWAFIDVAVLSLGGATVPIYPTLTADDIQAILIDSDARVVFAENRAQAEKILAIPRADGAEIRVITIESSGMPGLFSLEEFIAEAATEAYSTSDWRREVAGIDSSELASVVYTSGTSGRPKGVELTHANFLAVMLEVAETMKVNENDVTLLFLPVAHVFGRIEQLITLSAGWVNAYAESLNALLDNLLEVRPTVLLAVPRIYEKIFASVQKKAGEGSIVARRMVRDAIDLAPAWASAIEAGHGPSLLHRARHGVLDRFVYSELRKKLGGRLRFAITGGAPLSREIAQFFLAAGIPVLEGYGLTETTGPIFVNTLASWRLGSVGQATPGAELRVAEDGEILLKGPTVFRGYHSDPNATRECFRDGYFATGDIGRLDGDGFLYITDRKKDIIVTAGGKNVAPQKIENLLKMDPLFSQVLVIGDNRPHLAALMTLQADEARKLATSLGLSFAGLDNLVRDPAFVKAVRNRVNAVNRRLAPFEAVKRFRLLPRDFSIEGGELTPSLKVKRKFCVQKYAPLVEDMYSGTQAEEVQKSP